MGSGLSFYTKLSGEALTSELTRLSAAQTVHKTDCITLQPSLNPENASQDRYLILQLDLPGGLWQFTGVFDGHAGEETVDYLVASLPPIVQGLLVSALANADGGVLAPATVSDLLVKAISEVDDSITRDIMGLFPGGPDAIAKLSDEQIDAIVNNFESGFGRGNNAKVLVGMRGSTALVSLVDPEQENLWVASLGDSQAVLGTKVSSKEWKASLLSSNHNGNDQEEVARLRLEHPGEREVILEDRVLGAIAVTRAIGDHVFKLPAIYTRRILANTKPGFRLRSKLNDFLPRNITPPYLSNIADVKHVKLDSSEKDGRFLIMCSDGLIDLYMYESDDQNLTTLEQITDYMVTVVGNRADPRSNAALYLLRDALGGNDEDKVSRLLTVERTDKWMDDVTVLVQSL
jgi:pyruvate dehydrogenase phosphatase